MDYEQPEVWPAHVYPMDGPKQHELTIDCWCEPERDPDYPDIVVHNEVH